VVEGDLTFAGSNTITVTSAASPSQLEATPFVAGDQVVFTSAGSRKDITLNEKAVTSGITFDSGKYTLSGDSGRLTLTTVGHTSPITVGGGTLALQNTSADVMCSGLITVGKGATLTGTATVQNVTMQQGATFLCELTAASNSRLTVSGNLTHSADTLLVSIPVTRQLSEGDELTVFDVAGSHTGTVIVKAVADDNILYEFDTSRLLSDGKLVVTDATTVLGDVNGSGTLDIGDAVCIVNYLVGKQSDTFIMKAADTNQNGGIDIGDAVTIVNWLVGKK
jgi:cytoskeletal protein CcmA (bactofilin family)